MQRPHALGCVHVPGPARQLRPSQRPGRSLSSAQCTAASKGDGRQRQSGSRTAASEPESNGSAGPAAGGEPYERSSSSSNGTAGAQSSRRDAADRGSRSASPSPQPRTSGGRASGGSGGPGLGIDNWELLVGDGIALTAFALWKQISAIVLSPDFPGWLAPITFNPLRFLELLSFLSTLTGAWVLAALLTGGYRAAATADLQAALAAVSRAWLVSMPVAAMQLVLTTAAESGALVGAEGFASRLPLAASLPGEPLGTAAGVLGVMAIWRCWYSVYLDFWRFLPRDDQRRGGDVFEEAARWVGMSARGAGCMGGKIRV